MKPSIVHTYNQFMSGCDRADQLLQYYGHHNRRSSKWWKKIFFWILEVTMLNAYIIFKSTRERPMKSYRMKSLTFLNFKKNLVTQLTEKAARLSGGEVVTRKKVGRPSKDSAMDKLKPGSHLVAIGTLARCQQCSTPQSVHRTKYFCTTCPSQPHLHPTCFQIYHAP